MEKISVIIPVYNCEKYLENCIESVIKQTYSNLEIIVINDGSTDSTALLCENIKLKDDRISVYHQNNEGIGFTRNFGVEVSTGDFIIFVDSDDWIDNNHIQDLYNSLKETGSDIAVTNFTQYIEAENRWNIHLSDADFYQQVFTPQEWFKLQYGQPHNLSLCFTVPWCKLYKRQLFENVMYPDDKHADDDYTTWKLYLLSDKIVYINRSSYIYRVNETSLTQIGKMSHVFSAEAVEQRLALLSLLDFDLELEKSAFAWRAGVNKDDMLKHGDIRGYKDMSLKLDLMRKYGKL